MIYEPSYPFFASRDAVSGPTAAQEIKSQGDALVTVPYFKLPPYGERFQDTEGRFPQLQQLEQFLEDMSETATRFWFAQVLPEKEGGKTEYLVVECFDGMWLMRNQSTTPYRYITTFVEEPDTA